MKDLIFAFCWCLFALPALAQQNPVSWSYSAEKVNDQEYNLLFTADVDNGWYIYSQHLDAGGPIPTSIDFDEGDHYSIVGEVEEAGDNRKEGLDELFGINVIKYGDRVVFSQRIQVTDTEKPVTGRLEFMTCDDQRCLPPKTVNFRIDLGETE